MAIAKLQILDEVNIKLEGVDVATRRKLVQAVEYFVPHARHTPAYKLGRWNGKVSFCDVGARSYLNLLERLLPVIQDAGYDIEIEDLRATHSIEFEKVDKDSYSHVKWPAGHQRAGEPIVINDHQVECINSYLENLTGVNIAPTGAGKAQPLYSKIKTPDGWTTMGEIRLGDIISIPNGSSATVSGIYPQGKKDIYEITFSDGRTARSCNEHLWNVYNKHWSKKWKTLDLNEIIRLKSETKGDYYIPLIDNSRSEDVELQLDPYFVGLFLGDGSFMHHRLGFTSADSEIIDYISAYLDKDYMLKHKDNYDYSLKFANNKIGKKYHSENLKSKNRNNLGHIIDYWKSSNFYINEFHKLGLSNKLSHEKFIPEVYKNSSLRQKELLIAGLVDTDGYVGKNGELSISTSSARLAKDIQEMIWSMGGIAKITSRIPSYIYKGEKKLGKRNYTVSIRYKSPKSLSNLPRKKDRLPEAYQYSDLKLRIEKIEYIGKEDAQCIMVDHPDHLYITDNYVVTHNTLITAILSHKVEKYGRSIVIVPTKDLVTQTEEDYRNMGLDVGVYFGDRKEFGKTHTICTWQSLESLSKRSKAEELEVSIVDFFENVVCVIVDEVHKAKADVLRKLLTTYLANAPIRWGLTGTMPEEEFERVSILASIGPMLGVIKTKELQEKGILANLHVNIWQLQDLGEAAFDSYQSELKWLTTNQRRLKFLAESVEKMTDSGNTLILVDRVQTGEALQALIPGSVFVSGKMKSTDRKEEYKEVQSVDDKVIIATYGVASTGINIVRIYNLVLFEPGKSFVRVIQSIGRGIRVAPDKKFVNVYDFCSNCKFSKKHLTKRKQFYKDAEYPFTVTKVNY